MKKGLLSLILFYLVLPAQAQHFDNSYALVIGIDRYEHQSQLNSAVWDAKAIAAFLHDQGYDLVITLYDHQATKEAILEAMQNDLAKRLKSNDRVLIFFAGHGQTDNLNNVERGFIIPVDGGLKSASWISMDELITQSRNMGIAHHQLFILDSCYSGSIATRDSKLSKDSDFMNAVTNRIAKQFIAASGKNQSVDDASGKDGHSLFVSAFLDAIQLGFADDDHNGYITFDELQSYIFRNASRGDQIPLAGTLPGHESGEYWFKVGFKGHTSVVKKNYPPSIEDGGKFRSDTNESVHGLSTDQELTKEAENLYTGRGIEQNLVRAAELFEQSSEMGNNRAKARLGMMYEHGQGELSRNENEAVRLCQESAQANDSLGMACLGYLYEEGRGNLPRDEEKALALFQKAADRGDAFGLAWLGMMYVEGRGGLQRDAAKAVELLRKSADSGEFVALTFLGNMYFSGLGGLPVDRNKAGELYQIAAEHGEIDGFVGLAGMYFMGVGAFPKDPKRAIDLCKIASDHGSADGTACLGALYGAGISGFEFNERKAVELYQSALNHGNMSGLDGLATFYLAGRGGMAKNQKKAVELLEYASDHGDLSAMGILGSLYLGGVLDTNFNISDQLNSGITINLDNDLRSGFNNNLNSKDMKRGLELVEESAAHNDLLGLVGLGIAYQEGLGITANLQKATELFQMAADMDSAAAMTLLGSLYESGRGVPKDGPRAVRLFRAAAERGDSEGMFLLGYAYEKGKDGLSKDRHSAIELYKKAAERGNEDAVQRLRELKQ